MGKGRSTIAPSAPRGGLGNGVLENLVTAITRLPKVKVAAIDYGRWASRRISLGYDHLVSDALWT
jgi:hypothetical protein